MDEKFEFGEHVKANLGGDVTLGHVVSGAHTNDAGEQKFTVLGPDGSRHELAYTDEPVAKAGGGFFTRV